MLKIIWKIVEKMLKILWKNFEKIMKMLKIIWKSVENYLKKCWKSFEIFYWKHFNSSGIFRQCFVALLKKFDFRGPKLE